MAKQEFFDDDDSYIRWLHENSSGFVRGKVHFVVTGHAPTDGKTGPRYPLLLSTGRILNQYNVGAQTRRTDNAWGFIGNRMLAVPRQRPRLWRSRVHRPSRPTGCSGQ